MEEKGASIHSTHVSEKGVNQNDSIMDVGAGATVFPKSELSNSNSTGAVQSPRNSEGSKPVVQNSGESNNSTENETRLWIGNLDPRLRE